jgi:hypothetical protein
MMKRRMRIQRKELMLLLERRQQPLLMLQLLRPRRLNQLRLPEILRLKKRLHRVGLLKES